MQCTRLYSLRASQVQDGSQLCSARAKMSVAKTAGRSCTEEAFHIESHSQIAHVPSERTLRTFLTDQGLVCSR